MSGHSSSTSRLVAASKFEFVFSAPFRTLSRTNCWSGCRRVFMGSEFPRKMLNRLAKVRCCATHRKTSVRKPMTNSKFMGHSIIFGNLFPSSHFTFYICPILHKTIYFYSKNCTRIINKLPNIHQIICMYKNIPFKT